MFDPCGTRKLEAEDILKILAEYLKADVIDLKDALARQSQISKAIRDMEKQANAQ